MLFSVISWILPPPQIERSTNKHEQDFYLFSASVSLCRCISKTREFNQHRLKSVPHGIQSEQHQLRTGASWWTSYGAGPQPRRVSSQRSRLREANGRHGAATKYRAPRRNVHYNRRCAHIFLRDNDRLDLRHDSSATRPGTKVGNRSWLHRLVLRLLLFRYSERNPLRSPWKSDADWFVVGFD